MKSFRFSVSALATAAGLAFAPAVSAVVGRVDLLPASPGVSRLFPEGGETVSVSVRDARAPDPVLSEGFIGRNAFGRTAVDEGKGGYLAFYGDAEDAARAYIEKAAIQALPLLGAKAGDGKHLELSIENLHIESCKPWAYGAVNYIAFAKLHGSLRDQGGAELSGRDVRVALYESSQHNPRDPLGALLSRIAWQATAQTLVPAFGSKPDSAAVQAAIASLKQTDDDLVQANALFWIGLSGDEDPSVSAKLMEIVESEKLQRTREAAALALGMLGAASAKTRFEAVLARTERLANWDLTDTQNDWQILHALALLGATDLERRIPKTEALNSKLLEVVRFDASGEFPKPNAKMMEKGAEARQKIRKKLAKG